jgi:rhodanese-related sulfurtransferase
MGHLWKRVGTGLWLVMAAMTVTVVALVGLMANSQQPPGKELLMTFAEFRPLHAHKSVLVVDVRDADSFANGRIPGAVHVPVRDTEARLASVKKAAKGRVIVTYCSCPTESSSLRAAKLLSEKGLTAKALVGGFPRWVESGGPIERDGP